jgi:hypothetical protein
MLRLRDELHYAQENHSHLIASGGQDLPILSSSISPAISQEFRRSTPASTAYNSMSGNNPLLGSATMIAAPTNSNASSSTASMRMSHQSVHSTHSAPLSLHSQQSQSHHNYQSTGDSHQGNIQPVFRASQDERQSVSSGRMLEQDEEEAGESLEFSTTWPELLHFSNHGQNNNTLETSPGSIPLDQPSTSTATDSLDLIHLSLLDA